FHAAALGAGRVGALRRRPEQAAAVLRRGRGRLAADQPSLAELPVARRQQSRTRRRGAARAAVALCRSRRAAHHAPDRGAALGHHQTDHAPRAGSRTDRVLSRPGDHSDLRRGFVRGHRRVPARRGARAVFCQTRVDQLIHRDGPADTGPWRDHAMADADRTATHALTLLRDLQERPFDFGFFQAVRRIENLYRDKPRTGASSHASDDPVRLVQEPTTAFAPATLASFAPGEGKSKPRLSSYFFGLLGPNGPLPIHLTEYGRDRLRNAGDATFVRFLDLFHHRLLSLFYRAWAINHPAVSFDRPEDDRFAAYVGALFGLGLASLRGRDPFPDVAR